MRQAPSLREDYLYFEELKTRWRDSDVYGHMNNAVFYEYADTIVNSWLIKKGSLNVPSSKTVGLVVETRCTYFSELKFPSLITAGLKLNKLGNSSVHYEIGLFSDSQKKTAARISFIHVFVDAKSRKAKKIPSKLLEPLNSLIKN